jgi:multidrug efflux pump subunit AcrB
MNLVKASLRHPQVVSVITALICVAGVLALFSMPRREDPVSTIRRGLVMAIYPGASAEEVEEQVTGPLETRLFAHKEVRKAKTVSHSMSDFVVIDVTLEDDVMDIEVFWSKLRHDLNEFGFMSLPQGVVGPIVNSDFGDVVAVLLSITGDRYGARELQTYAERLETELQTLPQVSRIRRIGVQPEKIYVTSSLQRLVQHGIGPLQVMGALSQQNVVSPAGSFDAAGTQAPIRTSGLYQTEEQIRRQIVGVSPINGAPIYLGDFATVERRYGDPDFFVRANGEQALMLTIEMRAGENVVTFGEDVDAAIERVQALIPPDVEIKAMVDQPLVVEESIGHFLTEFGLALIAVVAVCLLLLPLQVATIAATAIPITVLMTFAVLRFLGIELQQVSLAGFIIVLGMVVDDAIVIADNYVELLDHGVSRDEAAWRSASDLAVPVLSATMTIAAAFLPLLFIPGTTGEWLFSLPVTVALALTNSYLVAMLLTPLLCKTFIKQGLHAKAAHQPAAGTKKKFNMLDWMQALYDRTINYAMAHKRQTMAFGVVAVLAGVGMSSMVPQLFFPPAERDEFSFTIWMPEGTRVTATDAVVRRIEAELAKEPDVVAYASFVGQGAPRFFFSFEPVLTRPNVAQVVVHTTSAKATPGLVTSLRAKLPTLVPEAEVDLQRLTQGNPMWSPIEVRISGDDLGQLQEIGQRVTGILESTPNSYLVRNDFREDAYAVQVDLQPEVASRLGVNATTVSNMLAATFLGLPVSKFWEGDRAVDIVLRLDGSHGAGFEDVGNTYVVGPMAKSPLRGVAAVRPVWERSRIVRRNGVRTLTVGSYAEEGTLPSTVLKAAQSQIDTLTLPAGYSIKYGGEIADQTESFGHMSVGMVAGVFLIFLILLFQFRRVKDALIIMASVPLALFGAYFGLVITNNPFGFTSFMGLIALTGVVVRNAIILVDFIHERMAHGGRLEEAGLEAGKRRLRPIFLTTMAAAAGLLPMIFSGSGLWSPLASVIAFGLIFSMIFTLIVVPVLYVLATPESVFHHEREPEPRHERVPVPA